MKKKKIVLLCIVGVCLGGVIAPAMASIQVMELGWFTVDGGGGHSINGDYSVTGTIGQPDAGSMSGGRYTLVGGFWGGVVPDQITKHLFLPQISR